MMPQKQKLTPRTFICVPMMHFIGVLAPETSLKEIQGRHQELLKNPDATVFKLVNLHYTLPVLFRHVPTVPESHYRQIHVLPTMKARQVVDIMTREMGLQALEESSTGGAAARPSDYIFSQIKVSEEGTEGNMTPCSVSFAEAC